MGQASLLCSVFQTLRAGSFPGISADRTTYLKGPPMVSRAAAFFVRFGGWRCGLCALLGQIALRALCAGSRLGKGGALEGHGLGGLMTLLIGAETTSANASAEDLAG